LDRAAVYQEQATYCAYLLRRAVDPRRRALIERERQDWLTLAYQTDLWNEIEHAPGRVAEPRTFVRDRPRISSLKS
jgi:hypothetical protein